MTPLNKISDSEWGQGAQGKTLKGMGWGWGHHCGAILFWDKLYSCLLFSPSFLLLPLLFFHFPSSFRFLLPSSEVLNRNFKLVSKKRMTAPFWPPPLPHPPYCFTLAPLPPFQNLNFYLKGSLVFVWWYCNPETPEITTRQDGIFYT